VSELVHSNDFSSGSQQAPVHLSYAPLEFKQNFLLGSAAQSMQVVNLPVNGTNFGVEFSSGFDLLSAS
jgi:hypothetical protein